jgi:alkylation response protein AidB-like acyl-CoA dehydrogenase
MDLTLDATETELQQGVRRFLSDTLDADRRRAIAELPGAVDRSLWSRLAEMGVFAISLPEPRGGVGLGMAHAVIVFEELGRALVPGPLVPTYLAAAHVGGAATGELIVGLREGDGCIAEHLEAIDHQLVIGESALSLTGPPEGGHPAPRPLDPLTPVHLDCTSGDAEYVLGDANASQVAHLEGTMLVAAFQVGLAQGAVELGTEYATTRQQFGRVIGSFQAVKHLLVDAVVATDVARASVHVAAVNIDEARSSGEPDTGLAASVAGARMVASRAAHRAATACIQVHGGMGYSWELEAHLYLKRSLVLDAALGGVEASIRTVAASI